MMSCACSKSETAKPLPPEPVSPVEPAPTPASAFELQRGVNIGNWLSQSTDRGAERLKKFTKDDARKLASYGFDHIRIPVDEEQLFDENGKMDMETMGIIHNAIGWCKDAGLRVIFDMHDLRTHKVVNTSNTFWDKPEEQDKLVGYWSEIMGQLEKYPTDLLAYELMNEPIAPSSKELNELYSRIIREIRQKTKDRTLLLSPNKWNSVYTVAEMALPEGDTNIIIDFHWYEPQLLTHYQASWDKFAKLQLPGELCYPGTLVSDEIYNALGESDQKLVGDYRKVYDKARAAKMWKSAIEFAKSKGIRLHLGEFGCLPYAGQNNRLNWTSDIVALCKENGISYTYWEYNSLFGFATQGTGDITNQELLNCLIK